jgi:ABC-type glutathione transport system ATPase component
MSPAQHLLEVRGLCKTRLQGLWWQRRFEVRALDHVDLTLDCGRTLAVVGESGAGKTTLAMCLAGLEQPDEGDIRFEGKSLLQIGGRKRTPAGRDIQLIFQDSAEALSPRMSALEIVEEPLLIRGGEKRAERYDKAMQAMQQVGLSAAFRNRSSHELSGGQRQRLAIARAMVTEPKLLILDEALTGLDLSIQGQIVNLLLDLQSAQNLSYIYVSHNLEIVSRIADEVMILHEGRVAERVGPAALGAGSKQAVTASVESATGGLSLGAHLGA